MTAYSYSKTFEIDVSFMSMKELTEDEKNDYFNEQFNDIQILAHLLNTEEDFIDFVDRYKRERAQDELEF